MDDLVRLSEEQYRVVYEKGFQSWARLYSHVAENPRLPTHALLVQNAFQEHPILPQTLKLELDKESAFATGFSVWSSTGSACSSGLPTFKQPLAIQVATKEPILLSISHTDEGKSAYERYFERHADHIAILILAWTYILSARWTETMPGNCTIAYTQAQAADLEGASIPDASQDTIELNLGNAEVKEARWWAAVLAQNQGWEAHIQVGQDKYISPWSIDLRANQVFALRHKSGHLPLSQPAASFSDACGYLNKFCTDRNIIDQSHAALASALLLPSMSSPQPLYLPKPSISALHHFSGHPIRGTQGKLQHGWMHNHDHMDKLLALSCNSSGIRSMLLSAFYEPTIECNAVTPWLQGSLRAIHLLAGENAYFIVRMCMERATSGAFLWLGSLFLGLQKRLLNQVESGQIPIDIHSAAWSGTIQSFIQQPVSEPLVSGGHVSRADECRLLFLSRAEQHTRLPLCQWKPFGTTPFDAVDIEVRTHMDCGGHQLEYKGVSWNCQDGQSELQKSRQGSSGQSTGLHLHTEVHERANEVPTCFDGLDFERDAASANETRKIFDWLRPDGHVPGEGNIFDHGWFRVQEESDELDFDEQEST